ISSGSRPANGDVRTRPPSRPRTRTGSKSGDDQVPKISLRQRSTEVDDAAVLLATADYSHCASSVSFDDSAHKSARSLLQQGDSSIKCTSAEAWRTRMRRTRHLDRDGGGGGGAA